MKLVLTKVMKPLNLQLNNTIFVLTSYSIIDILYFESYNFQINFILI